MDIKAYFAEKLSKVMFLKIKKEVLSKMFNYNCDELVYLPINASRIADRANSDTKGKNNLEEIPVSFFIEGMFYVIGADSNFKYAPYYIDILTNMQGSTDCIKGLIYKEIESSNYEEAYINLKGLKEIEKTCEIYDKILFLCDELRKKHSIFKEEELLLISEAKCLEDYATPFICEAYICAEDKDYEGAYFNLNNYIAKGGNETAEITEFKHNLKNLLSYDKGKELLYEDPEEALKCLIPLMDEFGDDPYLFFYIAVGYRILENCEKAIYYLNESLAIDNNIVEVVNELGINYAMLGEYDKAILYLKKGFEITKSVEMCTNIIMCYLNKGDNLNAKNHYELAKKLDPKDEVVLELSKIFER